MKAKIMLWIIIVSVILTILPIAVYAAANDFSAILSVSDTQVEQGSTVTSTINIVNLDKTYGADINITYEGNVISTFYLAAGKSKSIQHSIVINMQIDIFYTVNASHGPDINNTKDTNAVTIYIKQPATPTPTITENNSAEPNVTTTPTRTPLITTPPSVTPTVSEDTLITAVNADNIGWGIPISKIQPPEAVLSHFSDTDILSWLGITTNSNDNFADINSTTSSNQQNVYTIRRWLVSLAVLLFLIIVVILVIVIISLIKKTILLK